MHPCSKCLLSGDLAIFADLKKNPTFFNAFSKEALFSFMSFEYNILLAVLGRLVTFSRNKKSKAELLVLKKGLHYIYYPFERIIISV